MAKFLTPWVFVLVFHSVAYMNVQATIFVSDQNTRTVWTAEPFEETDTFVGAPFTALPLNRVLTPWAVEYDAMNDMIYWGDQGYAEIARSRLDGSQRQTVAINPVAVYPRGIALDPENDRIYWADAGTRKVESATLAGSDRRTLATGLVEARDVVLSAKYGFVFWCYDGNSANGRRIERANSTDGSNRTVLVSSGLTKPTGLAMNYDQTRVYWCDYEAQRIESVDFNGGSRTVHVDRNTISGYAIRPWRMALYGMEDYIYFTDNVNRVLFGQNANGGFSPVPRTNFYAYPYDVSFPTNASSAGEATVKPMTEKPTTETPTTEKPTTMKSTTTEKSTTEVQFITNSTQVEVTEEILASDSMFISDQNTRSIWTADASAETSNFVGSEFSVLPLSDIATPWAVEYDGVEEMLYWTDQGRAEIARSRLDGSNRTTIVIQPVVVYPRGIALDTGNDRIYWVDAGTRKVESSTLDGSDLQTLATGLVEPRDIAITVDHGFIFWCQDGDETFGPIIERANLDGSNRTIIVEANLTKPTGLAVNYDETLLYWCDYEGQVVESVDFAGGSRMVHLERATVKGFDIRPWRVALYGMNDVIYFTDNVNRVLFGPDIYGDYVPIPRKNFFEYPYDIAFAPNSSIGDGRVTEEVPTGSTKMVTPDVILVLLLSALVISKLQND